MALEIKDVTKDFGGIRALDGLSVELAEECVTGLIGPNGAGKTTLFDVVSGTLPPSGGTVALDGEVISGQKPHVIARKGIARTFQTPQPIFQLTVEENVRTAEHFGRDASRGGSSFGVDSVLELVGLADKRDERPENLQLVEQKYVDFARALAMAPDIVLLDEMLAGLNPAEKEAFGDAILRIHEETGTDFFVIEHDMRTIRKLADDVLVINNGRMIAFGPTEDVMARDEVKEAYLA